MTCRVHLMTLLLSTFAITATAQRPDSLTGELRQTLREVRAVHELPDGRALVLDSHERFVYLADFRTGDSRVIGEQGWADRQYLWPSRLLRRADDTTFVWDAIAGRIHVLDWVRGEPGIRRSMEKQSFSALSPVESDGLGRLYSDVQMGDGGSALVRWSPGEQRIDTLLQFRRARVDGLFPAWDRWTVSSTGVVAYVHVSPYRVDLRAPGASDVVGKPIAFEPKIVTSTIQRAWTATLHEPRIVWSQSRGEQPTFVEKNDSPVEYGAWPMVTPAFVGIRPLLQFSSDGSLLVERTAITGLPSEYDVIDERAQLADRFQLPAGTRIVATGRDVVYLTNRGADGRLTLQRFSVRRR